MNIYAASSWRNERQPVVVERIRALGHEVYDFRHPEPGNEGFSWRQVTEVPKSEWTPAHYRDQVLTHPVARRGFQLDMGALHRADACVLVLPCGRSAHLELGYAAGANKRSYVLLDDTIDEPELMYLMCTKIVFTVDDLCLLLGPGTDAMRAHSYDKSWDFVVPPRNDIRVVISQRQDGPFRGNNEKFGNFHIGVEKLGPDHRWAHVPGSAEGAFRSYEEAEHHASRVWTEIAKKETER